MYFDLYEEKKFYDETKLLFQEQYTIKQIDTYGLLIGSRGTIPKYFSDIWKQLKLDKKVLIEMSKIALASNINI